MALTEYLFLTPSPEPTQLQVMLAGLDPSMAHISTQFGTDALGRERCTLEITGPTHEQVAAQRQAVLHACKTRDWKAIVV